MRPSANPDSLPLKQTTLRFPLIGNYGVIPPDFESEKPHIKAYVVREYCEQPSNFRNEKTIDTFLKDNNVVGVYGVDTRELTKIIRESGVMNAMILSGDELPDFSNEKDKDAFLKKVLPEIKAFVIKDAVESVTQNADKIAEPANVVFERSAAYRAVPVTAEGLKVNDQKEAAKAGKNTDGTSKKVLLWDFGAKANIRRELLKRGLEVETVPCNITAEEIIAKKPDGIMLSNGPGDPAENVGIINELGKVSKTGIPLFGICLGHQLLALARGGKTEKLLYGHRGANQPVKQLKTGRVFISSQNHGYAVTPESLPKGAELSFINTNDDTCEGIQYTDIPAFSVQFHPEASGGPLDTGFLFDDFVSLIRYTE